jgi:hypothetical protein
MRPVVAELINTDRRKDGHNETMRSFPQRMCTPLKTQKLTVFRSGLDLGKFLIVVRSVTTRANLLGCT